MTWGPEQSGPLFLSDRTLDSPRAAQHADTMRTSGAETAALERRALQLESAQDLVGARDMLEQVLCADPHSRSAIEGRARIALKLREPDAADHCARALAYHDADPELQVQMIGTAASILGVGAIPLLESYLKRNPADIGAVELMSSLQAQAGAGDEFVDCYHNALACSPDNRPVLMSYWNTLTRSGRHLQALDSMDANRSVMGSARDFAMLEIAIAAHSGDVDRATALLERQDDQSDARLARGLNSLQRGDPAAAAQYLETVVAEEPDNLEAWSLLELAWRQTDKQKHRWLVGNPRLYGALQLNLSDFELNQIAQALRTMHDAKAQPLGQSVRGGTQTPGELFARNDPEIVQLTGALADAIRTFVTALPAADPSHPLLKHRNGGMAFGPSWSIRLASGGFHAAHFHPGGMLSSACYISLPQSIGDESERSGWLELGRPPDELGLQLEPLDSFEPKPGRLVLFPSFLFHGTRPFDAGERLTVAFDLVPVPA